MKRKGQEEIAGFVLIVVLVAVIALVFLAIMIRKEPSSEYRDSREVKEFLSSSMEFTTKCALNYEPAYLKLGEVAEECYKGNSCISGNKACEVLKEIFPSLIESSWNIQPDSYVKGYSLNITYRLVSNESVQNMEEIYSSSKGICDGPMRGSEELSPAYPGDIVTRLVVCY